VELVSRINEVIREKGYRKSWVAEQIGVSRQQLGNWSRGTSYPPLPKAFELARLLDVEITDLWAPI